MKKSIFISALLVCMSAIAFGQGQPAAPQAQPEKKVTPAPSASGAQPGITQPKKVNTGKNVSTSTPSASGSSKTTKSVNQANPSPNKTGAANSGKTTPQGMTGPHAGSSSASGGGAKPTAGTRWKGGKAQGPVAKSKMKAAPETPTTDKK